MAKNRGIDSDCGSMKCFSSVVVLGVLVSTAPEAFAAGSPLKLDPTAPIRGTFESPIEETGSDAALKLQAIFNHSGEYVAVINGAVVKRGGFINGLEVLMIEKNSVRLSGTSTGVLTLFPDVLHPYEEQAD